MAKAASRKIYHEMCKMTRDPTGMFELAADKLASMWGIRGCMNKPGGIWVV